MIERILFNAIKNGIDGINADPDEITAIFQKVHGLEPEEAQKIRDLWAQKPPELHHGYARTDSNFPAYFITLTGENESENWLGNESMQFLDDEGSPDYGSFVRGAIWTHTFNVLVYAQHPDVCLYMYQVLKAIFIAQDPYLRNCGLLKLRYSGSDMAPDQTWMPAGLFLRRFTVEAQSEYNQITPDADGRAWKVAGIHIDSQGAPGESVGGVKTLVTVSEG